MIGKIFDDRFEIIEQLAEGGMGHVYFAKDLNIEFNYKLIMKVSKPEHIYRFKTEIKIMSRLLNFPKVAKILHSNLESKNPYYIMKFYENGNLQDFYTPKKLKNDFKLQQEIFLDMIDCIKELHNKNKYHRDIKPDNFLIDDNENILVSDFGLSVDLDSTSKRITKSLEYAGTDGYCPPEFSKKAGAFKNPDAQSDIYMLGKSFYSLLTGDKNPSHVNNAIIDSFLHSIIDKACEIDKEKRYKNLGELKSELKKTYNYKLTEKSPYEKARDLCQKIYLNNNDTIELFELFLILEKKEKKDILKNFPVSFFKMAMTIQEIDLKYVIEVYKEIVEVDDALNNWSIYKNEFMDNFRKSMRIIVENSYYKNNEIKAIALYLLVIISGQRGEWPCKDTLKSLIDEEFVEKAVVELLSKNLQNNNCINEINASDCKSSSIRKLVTL